MNVFARQYLIAIVVLQASKLKRMCLSSSWLVAMSIS